MKSMTGYGRGECAQDGFKVTVELSSVNRKQAEVSVTLPREMDMLETQIRAAVAGAHFCAVRRGQDHALRFAIGVAAKPHACHHLHDARAAPRRKGRR